MRDKIIEKDKKIYLGIEEKKKSFRIIIVKRDLSFRREGRKI